MANSWFHFKQFTIHHNRCAHKVGTDGEWVNKFVNFISESRQLIELANNGNREEVKKFINNCSLLFKGPCGIRHMDFVAYKDD